MPRYAPALLTVILLATSHVRAADSTTIHNTQAETVPLLTPEQALRCIALPEGFAATLFASEPVVSQPIGIATDARGRLWVAENNTYAEVPLGFDNSQRDRIVVLEDADHDGRAERHTVFWDQAQKLTSVETGFGGVWALCPPRLLFIPDRNGDDIPDGEPEVVLDGFNDAEVRHNIANGLRWGPDGWLYGRHGILSTSLVAAPGTPPAQRTPVSCSIWRYHPTRKLFEVVCRGTTNSWGMDWDEHGELFFINTVIGHLWHAVPGAHFQRMYGEDANPHTYQLIGQTADHVHWDTAEAWSEIRKIGVSPTTDQAGGGHAHSGLLIYQGDNWPNRYRGTVLTINFHGRRLNNDTLERQGAGYVAHHGADLLQTSDPWFRGLDLITGADGGVYIADWSDIGECHDNDGIHRTSGRIYKIVYGRTERTAIAAVPQGDVRQASDAQLVDLQFQTNEWLVRQSRQVLQERAAAGRLSNDLTATLRSRFAAAANPLEKVRLLWCLHVTDGASDDWLLAQLDQPDEHVRAGVVRLLGDGKVPSPQVLKAIANRAAVEPSGLVSVYMAATLQALPVADLWLLAERLAAQRAWASDPVFPLMLWYGIEPAVPENPAQAVKLAASCQIPLVTQFIARRLAENLQALPAPIDELIALAADARQPARSQAILTGVAEALRGWRKAPVPPSWNDLSESLAGSSVPQIAQLVRELSVVFGDGRALDELLKTAASKTADPVVRRDALRVLVEARANALVPILRHMIDERDLGADAVQALAAFDDATTPELLLQSYPGLKEPARAATIVTLSTRPAWARALLVAVAAGKIDRSQVPAFQVRQMSTFPDDEVRRRTSELWPELRMVSTEKKTRIEQLKSRLAPTDLASADLSKGRQRFVQACATCHTLFGQGTKIGPDLTGAQRANLDYLLENIVDPAATVTEGFRMSTVVLSDGRLLSGILANQGAPILALQTPTERLAINRADVEEIHASTLSLMPEGLLDPLPEKDLRDLVGYLMSPQQVPLPAGAGQ
jgi:putative membrane-bound dehydrogenase-like protein